MPWVDRCHRRDRQVAAVRPHGGDDRARNRHVGAVADQLVKALREAGFGKPRIEGLRTATLGAGRRRRRHRPHLRPEVREFYNIEKMWSASSPPTPTESCGFRSAIRPAEAGPGVSWCHVISIAPARRPQCRPQRLRRTGTAQIAGRRLARQRKRARCAPALLTVRASSPSTNAASRWLRKLLRS